MKHVYSPKYEGLQAQLEIFPFYSFEDISLRISNGMYIINKEFLTALA